MSKSNYYFISFKYSKFIIFSKVKVYHSYNW